MNRLRVVTTRPTDKRPSARATSGNESLPVSGSLFLVTVTFFVLDITTAAIVVVVEAAIVVVGDTEVATAGMVTTTDCDEPLNVVRVLLLANPMENEDATVRVDVTATPPATAWLVAPMVHSDGEVCVIDVISVIPVKLKSTPEADERVAQSMASAPVTLKVIDAELEVDDDEASVAESDMAL